MKETLKVPEATALGYVRCPAGGCFDMSYPGSSTRRGRVQGGGEISPTVTCSQEIVLFEGYEEI